MISPGISPSRGYGRWCECGCVGGCSSGLGVVVYYLWVLVPARDTGGGASVVVCYIWVLTPAGDTGGGASVAVCYMGALVYW